MDFVTELFEKIVKLVFDILNKLGVNTDNVPGWIKPDEETEA